MHDNNKLFVMKFMRSLCISHSKFFYMYTHRRTAVVCNCFFYIASKRKCFSKHSHELSLVARTKNECEQDICKNINKCRARKKSIKPVCKWNDIKKRMNEQTDKIRWNIQNEYRIGTSKSKTKKIRIKFCFRIYNGLKWSTSAVPWGKFRKTMKTDK